MVIRTNWLRFLSRKSDRRTISHILEAAAIPTFILSLPRIKREIARVRRFQRPLAIVSIALNGDSSQENEWRPVHGSTETHRRNSAGSEQLSPIAFALCGPVFQDALREIDITTFDRIHNQFVIALPETDKQRAFQMVNRVRKIVGESISKQLSFGVAEFPTDGLIVDDLVGCAMKGLGKTSVIGYSSLNVPKPLVK
jgi:hypothetical protein